MARPRFDVLGLTGVAQETIAASPLAHRLVIVVGAPDAATAVGTALGTVEGVRFAPVPTEIFARGLVRFAGSFVIGQQPGPGAGTGVAALFDSAHLTQSLRELADELLREACGGAEVLVDHSPGTIENLDLAALVYPDAVFVHAVLPPAQRVAAELLHGNLRGAMDGLAATSAAAVAAAPVTPIAVDVRLLAADPDAALAPVLSALGRSGSVAVGTAERVQAMLPPVPGRLRGAMSLGLARGALRLRQARRRARR
jgi:hypothetical protein